MFHALFSILKGLKSKIKLYSLLEKHHQEIIHVENDGSNCIKSLNTKTQHWLGYTETGIATRCG